MNKKIKLERIFFVGFMGSGKSFFGEKLAKKLGWKFVDLDAKIEAEMGEKITQIFQERGENVFREIEQKMLRRLFLEINCVIATGGGTPCFFENMKEMQQNGLILYLKTTKKLLFARLWPEKTHRPLIANLSKTKLRLFISEKIDLRKAFYEQADLSIFQSQNDPDFLKKIEKKIPKTGIQK
jgi:shikimate kinase